MSMLIICLDYLFKKLANFYREESNPEEVQNILMLLDYTLQKTDNCLKPRNYFSCAGGNSKFNIDLSNYDMKVRKMFAVIISFKVGKFSNIDIISNLININFSNNDSINF